MIMDYFCSVDVNFWNKPLFGHMPRFMCYLVQAAHRGLVRLPGTLAFYTAHVSERNEKFIHALAQYTVILITVLVRILGCKSILLL